MGHRVDISIGDPGTEAFQKSHVVGRYKHTNLDRKKLCELWKQVYDVTIIFNKEDSHCWWAETDFHSEQDYVAFMLRWA